MGSRPQPPNLRQEEGRLLHAALVEQEEDEDDEEGSEESSSDSTSRAEPVTTCFLSLTRTHKSISADLLK